MTIKLRILTGAVALAFAGSLAGPASAESQAWTWCVNKAKASPDLQISGCTTVIQSGKESKSNLAIAFNNRGNGFRKNHDNDRALADYNQAIRLNPKLTIAYNGRGNAYNSKKDYDRALADYGMAIHLNPKYAFAYNGRGNVYNAKKDYDRSIADCSMSIKLDPKMRRAA